MSNRQVRVGQVWEDSRDGETFYVQEVKRSIAVGIILDGSRTCMSLASDTCCPLSPTWTLIQDVSPEVPAHRVDAVCHCERAGCSADLYPYHGTANCSYSEDRVAGTPCPPRVAPKAVLCTCINAMYGQHTGRCSLASKPKAVEQAGPGACDMSCDQELSKGHHYPDCLANDPCPPRVAPGIAEQLGCTYEWLDTRLGHVAWGLEPPTAASCKTGNKRAVQAKPVDPCAALRASLPKSEQMYLEGSIGENEPAEQAVNEVRRKVASMRNWPVCPVSTEPLRIEARVKADVRGKASNLEGHFFKGHETLNTWHAEFTCDCCGRGGK